MSLERSARPMARCLRCTRHNRIASRSISATTRLAQEETTTEPPSSAEPPPPSPPPPAETAFTLIERINAEYVSNPRKERLLWRNQREFPIASRRRRAALATASKIPFEELPYQCFQEARKVLQGDRAEKVAEIEEMKAKIAKESAKEVPPEKERMKEVRIKSWTKEIERLKILADSNDPLVKKNFEDGFGDMNKPIYRHLSDLKWRSHKRQVLMQRITQMNVVPDVLPAVDPTVSMTVRFNGSKVPPGDFVLAAKSALPPQLDIQSYDKGSKLVTIAVVTPDVPNVEKDGFDYRCHFLASNVVISPTRTHVALSRLTKKNVILDWLPPYSQKGAPYQRLAVFVLEQPLLDPASAAALAENVAASASETMEPELAYATGESLQAYNSRASASPPPEGASEGKTAAGGTSSEATVTEPAAIDAASSETPPADATVTATEPLVSEASPSSSPASSEATPAEPTVVDAASSERPPADTTATTASPPASEPSPTSPPAPASDTTSPTPISDPKPPTINTTHQRLPIATLKADARYTTRENFLLHSLATKYRLRPIGVDLFRAQWDETTAAVMAKARIAGGDVEFKRMRVDPLPYQRLKGERYR